MFAHPNIHAIYAQYTFKPHISERRVCASQRTYRNKLLCQAAEAHGEEAESGMWCEWYVCVVCVWGVSWLPLVGDMSLVFGGGGSLETSFIIFQDHDSCRAGSC